MAKKSKVEPTWFEPVTEQSMWDKINSDFYKTKLPYPTVPKKPAGPVLTGKTPQDYRNHASALESYASNELAKYAEDMAEYNALKGEYHDACDQLDEMFWKDATNDVFSDEFSKKFPTTVACMISKAYVEGHSEGYSGMYNTLLEMGELAEAFMKDIENQEKVTG